MVALWNVTAVAPPLGTDYGWSPEPPHDPCSPRCRRVVGHPAGPSPPPGTPPDARPPPRPHRRPDQGQRGRARDRVRDVGFPVSLLPRVRPRHDAGARARVHPAGQSALRVHQPAPDEPAQERRRGRRGRAVRRPAAAVFADARFARPPPGPVGCPRLAPSLSPRARRLGGAPPPPPPPPPPPRGPRCRPPGGRPPRAPVA